MEVYVNEGNYTIEVGDVFLDIDGEAYILSECDDMYWMVSLGGVVLWIYSEENLESIKEELALDVKEGKLKHYSKDEFALNLVKK